MPGEPATGFLHYRRGTAASPELDVQVQVQACFLAEVSKELDERTLALALHTDEDYSPRCYRATPPHRCQPSLGTPPSTPARYLE